MPTNKSGKNTLRNLMGATALIVMSAGSATAQSAYTYDIGPQPLRLALSQLARQSGLNLAVPTNVTVGRASGGVIGTMSPDQALASLLQGSGLSLAIVDGTVTLPTEDRGGVLGDGSVMLGTIVVSGGTSAYWDGSPEAIYDTTSNVSAVTSETLETYQITTPSDILRGTTGVLSGDSRNSGSLDVNIHGLQGQGRVPVTIDGAENNVSVYRGYQGRADRTFIDPDFISSVGIEKGGNVSRSGIGGAVSVTTLNVDDVVREGERTGFRLKFSLAGNSSDPVAGTETPNGAERPSLLSPTNGSASLAYGIKGDVVDFVAAVSRRDTGNFHAGSNGDTQGWTYNSGRQEAWGDLSLVGADKEVLNTSNSVHSAMAKLTFNFSDDLKWQLGASKYNTAFGELMPSRYTVFNSVIQEEPSETDLVSLTSRVRWNPEGSDLVDVTWNTWHTDLEAKSTPMLSTTNAVTFGTDISNRSIIDTDWGAITWTNGASYKREKNTSIGDDTLGTPYPDGTRYEASAFSTGEWAVNDWLSINGGLRYTYAESRSDETNVTTKVTDAAVGKSIGFAVKPNDDLTIYANYNDTSRLPSYFEAWYQSGSANLPEIDPERSRNLDVGINYLRENIVGDDSLRLKASYFDNNTEDYIARNFGWYNGIPSFYSVNLDKVHFRGFDLSTDYELGGFAAKFGATYYTKVDFCDGGSCAGNTTGSDYAKNHIPPKFQLSLDLSQKFLDDDLTLGGRMTRMGPRATDAGEMLSPSIFIAPIVWKPVTLVDLYAHYNINKDTRISFDVQNVTDEYYIEPLGLSPMPGPGRTARISLDYRF
jgi:hemoglobin/transferrin/lactoferrin receptor protein